MLAAVGIYGVLTYSVVQRTREIGIRVALGAERIAVAAMIVRQGMVLTGLGVAAGLAGAMAVTRYLEGMLYGLTPFDVDRFVMVTVFLLATALLACTLPAWRALRVDPLTALRHD